MPTINSWNNTVTSAGSITLSTTNGAILMNSGTGTISVSNDASNTSINIGTGAAVKTLTLGSTNTTSSTTINFGGSTGLPLSSYASTTFTPTLAFGGGSTGITYATQVGKYWKIGSMVFVNVQLVLTNKGSSTGTATIVTLPFSSANDGFTQVMSCSTANLTYGALDTTIVGSLAPNSTSLTLVTTHSAATATVTLDDTSFANNTALIISGFYWV